MSNYIYYKFISNHSNLINIEINNKFIMHCFKPNIFRLSLHKNWSLNNIFWFFITFGRYRIYYIKYQNSIIHFSHVLPRFYKFPFMKERKSIHIGPCWTDPLYRGNNLYPYVLSCIIKDHINSSLYIFTNEDNIPSQKGIEKVGFKKKGYLFKSKTLGIYKVYS